MVPGLLGSAWRGSPVVMDKEIGLEHHSQIPPIPSGKVLA